MKRPVGLLPYIVNLYIILPTVWFACLHVPVSGLLLVVVHGGEKLLSMDDDGFSDPYCIIAADREKVRYITSTECTDYLF